MFYGLVEDKKIHDDENELSLVKDYELIVMFVVSSEFE